MGSNARFKTDSVLMPGAYSYSISMGGVVKWLAVQERIGCCWDTKGYPAGAYSEYVFPCLLDTYRLFHFVLLQLLLISLAGLCQVMLVSSIYLWPRTTYRSSCELIEHSHDRMIDGDRRRIGKWNSPIGGTITFELGRCRIHCNAEMWLFYLYSMDFSL